MTAIVLLLAACGGGSASSSASPSRAIVSSSTATPGPPPPTPAGGPADPNSTVLTPYPTTPPTQAPAASAQASAAPAASLAPNQVRIQDFSFTPPALNVTLGTQVTWLNGGPSNHTVTANDGSFDSGTIQRNGTFAFTFSKAGTFAYHCSIHPTMTGTVTVT